MWAPYWDKTPTLRELEAGVLGFILGLDVYTDSTRAVNVLPNRMIYVMSKDGQVGVGIKIADAR